MTPRWRWIALGVAVPLVVLGVIAGTDGLFLRTVPLEQRLISRDDAIRKKAQQSLLGASAEQKQELTGRLLPALSRPDPFVRKWATIAFALMGPSAQAAIPTLLQTVSDGETEVAQAARVALSEIGAPDPAQVPVLIQALNHPHEDVRCEAAASLAKLGPAAEAAVSPLLNAVKRETPLPECFSAALVTLSDFMPHIEPSLVALVQAPDPAVRSHAADVLRRLPGKSTGTYQALLSALADEHVGDVRPHLAAALRLHETPELGMVPTLIAAAGHARDAAARATALEMLQKTPPPLSVLRPALAHALHDEDGEIRHWTLTWIVAHPEWTRALAPDLLKRLRDTQEANRRLALEALYHVPWHDHDLFVPIALAQRDADPGVRCMAVRQLVEMGGADRVSIDRLVDDLRREEDPACAVEALALTGYFNADVVAAMARLLDDRNDWRTRGRAVSVLMHLGSRAKAALPALVRAEHAQIPGAEIAVARLRQSLGRQKRRAR